MKNVADRAKQYLKENDALLKKHKLMIRLIINFARRTKTPLLSRIALWVVSKQGGMVDMQFGEPRKE